jgi:hypothetical protein
MNRTSRSGALTLAIAIAASIAACEQRSGLDGVWEVRGARIVLLEWDSSARRFRNREVVNSTWLDSLLVGEYVLLESSGQVVSFGPLESESEEWTERWRLAAAPTKNGAVLTGLGIKPRTQSDSGCTFMNILGVCTGDTIAFRLERVGDRRGNLPADTSYLQRSSSIRYWLNARRLLDVNLLEKVDALGASSVDTATISHMRGIVTIHREAEMLLEEVWRSDWNDTIFLDPSDVPMEILDRIAVLRKRLTTVGSEDPGIARRAQRLLRRLEELEQEALRLWRQEPQLRMQLSAKYHFDFPATHRFVREGQRQ